MSEVIQLSVFIANEAGRVSEVTNALGEATRSWSTGSTGWTAWKCGSR